MPTNTGSRTRNLAKSGDGSSALGTPRLAKHGPRFRWRHLIVPTLPPDRGLLRLPVHSSLTGNGSKTIQTASAAHGSS